MAKSALSETHTKTFHSRMIIIIGIAATFLAIIITSTGMLSGLESRSVDWRFKARGVRKPTAPVVIVSIDDDSFARMPERWTWPRNFYGKAVDNLKKWGAKVIGFDVIYSEPTARNPKEDKTFGDAIKKAGNIILGTAVLYEEDAKSEKRKAILPIPVLKSGAYDTGLIQHAFDEDTIIRRSSMVADDGSTRFYSLSLLAAGLYSGLKKESMQVGKEEIKWGKYDIPISADGMMRVNFAGPAGTFNTVSFYKVYFGEDVNPEQFKGKIVLVGSTADLLHDVFVTPFSSYGEKMPGVEIHANVINTIMNGLYIKRTDALTGFLLLLGIGILTCFMIFRIQAWQGMIVVAIEMLVYVFITRYMFETRNYLMDFVNPIFCMLFCYLSISTYKVGVEEREKHKIKNIFSKYVSDVLVEELLRSPELKLGGEKKEITVLFSDIRGFTTMSEKMQPEEVVHILNEYLSEMTEAIFVNKGTLDKFVGDAVMALFNTPAPLKDHALCAVRTAFLMKKKLAALNEKWIKEGKHPLKIGIGINTGEAIAGNMGSMKRMEYTVIGDTVNLASRLESATKGLGAEILISDHTYEQVKDHVRVKRFDNITVKGKEELLTVYDVVELLP
jgi:adenylate cyclase